MPTTTRATPGVEQLGRVSATVRTPPPACTGIVTAAAIAATTGLVGGHARPCRVQVDHVEPAGAGRLEGLRPLDGVGAVNGFPAEIALGQAHATASPQVYGRVKFHG